jgi:O-antigen/teichoic acid export membrane protein
MNWASLKESLSLKQRFNREVLWNVASVGVLGVSGVAINYVVGRYRGEAALGVFNQVYAIYIILSQFAIVGVHSSVLMHVSYNQGDARKCSNIASSAMVLGLAMSATICLLAVGLRHLLARWYSPEVIAGFLYVIPALLFFSMNKILMNVLNGLRNMRAYAVFNAMRFVLILATVIAVIAAGMRAECLPLGFTAAEVLLFVGLMVYVNGRLFALRLPDDLGKWLKEHWSYGLRGVFSGIISDLNTRLDVLMLGYFTTDKAVGIYTMAATLAEGFLQLPIILQRNLNPIIGKSFAEGDRKKIEEASHRVRRLLHPAMAATGLAAALVYPLLIRWFFPDQEFGASWPVFCILAASVVLQSGYIPIGGILFQGGRPGAQTWLMACSLGINAFLNIVLIPKFGIIGAAVATGLAYLSQAVLLLVFARRLFGVRLWR